jgi:hypothetical protein
MKRLLDKRTENANLTPDPLPALPPIPGTTGRIASAVGKMAGSGGIFERDPSSRYSSG